MDNNLKAINKLRIERTMENLKKNNMEPFFAETKEDALKLFKTLIKDGDSISHGGSETLKECGITDFLKNNKEINYLDRDRAGITPEEVEKVYRDTFFADVFAASSNAITEEGELYNVDGHSNRISAMVFGPKSVIVVAGYQKIVKDRAAAEERVKNIAAPANAIRLNCKTPCAKLGYCTDCKGDTRICSNSVFMSKQRIKNRIKVIIVGEEIGY
jgi:L-lactate utilization protein LutB